MAGYEFNPVYYNTLDQIYHVDWVSKKLARLELLKQSISQLWLEGHPTKLIHVAGTSGKGSVCKFIEAGLSLCGKTGSVVSPHLFDYRERFNIQGEKVSQDDVIEAWEGKILPICVELALKSEHLIHSEVYILIALYLFDKYDIEWGLIETGAGGRYDQTRALEVLATVLTNVGNDHQELLGREKWQRAIDKSGICRFKIPLFTSEQDEQTLSIIKSICNHTKAPLYQINQSAFEQMESYLQDIYPQYLTEDTLLKSQYQLWNATLSATVVRHFYPDISINELLKTFVNVRFQGRFEKIAENIYLDVAHNPDKINALVTEISKVFSGRRKIFVIGLSGRRSLREVFDSLINIADEIIVTTGFHKSQPATSIKKELDCINKRRIPIEIIPDTKDALEKAKSLQKEDDVVFLTGSTYMIDQALNPDPYLRYLNSTYGWRNIPLDQLYPKIEPEKDSSSDAY